MANNVTKTVIGRLTKDAEWKETEKVDIINLSVASNIYSSGKNLTEFNECYVFVNKDDKTKQADVLPKLYKGRWVVVLNGAVVISEWEKDGAKQQKSKLQLRSIYDVLIDPDIEKLKAKLAESDGTSGSSDTSEIDDDQIPF